MSSAQDGPGFEAKLSCRLLTDPSSPWQCPSRPRAVLLPVLSISCCTAVCHVGRAICLILWFERTGGVTALPTHPNGFSSPLPFWISLCHGPPDHTPPSLALHVPGAFLLSVCMGLGDQDSSPAGLATQQLCGLGPQYPQLENKHGGPCPALTLYGSYLGQKHLCSCCTACTLPASQVLFQEGDGVHNSFARRR